MYFAQLEFRKKIMKKMNELILLVILRFKKNDEKIKIDW